MTEASPKPSDTHSAEPDILFERELAGVCIEALNLDVTADEVDPLGALYEEGLGLDSIDILEIALVISKRYGLRLRADDKNNPKIFASLRSLAQHVQANRTR